MNENYIVVRAGTYMRFVCPQMLKRAPMLNNIRSGGQVHSRPGDEIFRVPVSISLLDSTVSCRVVS